MKAARAGARHFRRFAGLKTQFDLNLGRRFAGDGGEDGVSAAISEYRGRGSRRRLRSAGA